MDDERGRRPDPPRKALDLIERFCRQHAACEIESGAGRVSASARAPPSWQSWHAPRIEIWYGKRWAVVMRREGDGEERVFPSMRLAMRG